MVIFHCYVSSPEGKTLYNDGWLMVPMDTWDDHHRDMDSLFFFVFQNTAKTTKQDAKSCWCFLHDPIISQLVGGFNPSEKY